MSIKKMDFDMKTGERLRVSKGYVEVHEVDGCIRYYSLKGKMLGKFQKKELEENGKAIPIHMKNCILIGKDNYWRILTYIGVEICRFKATYNRNSSDDYLVFENDKKNILYDTEKRRRVGENFDQIWRWGKTFILKKDGIHYLYNGEKRKVEGKFNCYINKYKKGKEFIILYYNNKCGLWIRELHNEIFYNVLPIEYQKIEINGDEIIAIKNGKKEHYPLETITKKKKYHTNRNNENVGIQENQIKINFLNSIKVSFGEEVILKEKFILVLGKLNEKAVGMYYTLQGKYIGDSGFIRDEDGGFCGVNYVATENILALGGDKSIPFGSDCDWKIYDYEGNRFFKGKFEDFKQEKKYFLGIQLSENKYDRITYVFSDKGQLLFVLNNSEEVLEVQDEYFEILDHEDKIWFLDDKGKAIFNRGLKKIVRLYNGFVCEKIEKGYNVYDCNHRNSYYVTADLLKNMDYEPKLTRVTHKEKQGVISLNSSGYKIIVPVKYLEVKKYGEVILAQAEEWDDIYDFDGTLIMSTK